MTVSFLESVSGPTTTVTVGPTMAATWTGATDPLYGLTVTFTLTQSGSDLAGNFRNSSFSAGSTGVGLAKASVATLSLTTTCALQGVFAATVTFHR